MIPELQHFANNIIEAARNVLAARNSGCFELQMRFAELDDAVQVYDEKLKHVSRALERMDNARH